MNITDYKNVNNKINNKAGIRIITRTRGYLLIILALLASTRLFSQKLTDSELAGKGKDVPYSVQSDGTACVIQIGDYTWQFEAEPSWTFRTAQYLEKPWLQDTGFNQSVLNEKMPQDVKADPFLGTGHRKEQVKEITLKTIIKGKFSTPVSLNTEFSSEGKASAVIVQKKSIFHSEFSGALLEHEAIIVLNQNGAIQQFSFKGLDGKLENINFMYPFMHIFPVTAQYWYCGNDRGFLIENGEFKTDNSFTLNKAFRWAAIYEPAQSIATAYCYPETYQGLPGLHNRFWNRPNDNKLYFMSAAPKKINEEKTWRVTVSAIDTSAEQWQEKAAASISKITGKRTEFAAEKVAEPAEGNASGDLIFYAPFDEIAHAVIAGGSGKADTSGPEDAYTDGMRGKAILIGGGAFTSVSYTAENNIPISEGTVSFWADFSRYKSKAEGQNGVYHLMMIGAGGPERLLMQIQRGADKLRLVFVSMRFSDRKDLHITDEKIIESWLAGGWHHICITWKNTEVQIYLDGKLSNKGNLAGPYTESDFTGKILKLGIETAVPGQEQTAIDEYKIFKKAMTLSEVEAFFKAK